MISSVFQLIFSPAGTTRRVVSRLGNYLAEKVTQCDLMKRNLERHTFAAHDLVVVGVPVYGGRVPAPALNAIRKFSGNGTPVVSVVVYGNRHYDDALLELNDTLKENGFRILASGAFVGRHSLAPSIAQGRPDDADRDDIDEFIDAILDKYKTLGKTQWEEPAVPGNRPYKDYTPAPVAPYTTHDCSHCGFCVTLCPVDAITLEATDPDKCILCMRCVTGCPQKARRLPEAFAAQLLERLQTLCSARRDNEVFI